jgi:hypothetical protein
MSHAVSTKRYEGLHGALAEFDTPEELIEACEKRMPKATGKWMRSRRCR